jgi:signal transduction histidine kinase
VVAARARMRTWTLRRRVAASFGAFALAFAVVVIATVVSLVQVLQHGNDVVYRWGPAASRSQALLEDMINQETGVRGYALSGRPESLQPYQTYRAQEPKDAAALRTYLTGNEHLLVLLNQFQVSVGVWQVETAQPLIDLVRAGDRQAAIRVDSAADRIRFDDIRARSAALSAGVQRELQRARSARQTAFTWLIIALCVAAAVIVLGAVAVWRGLHRWVLGPVDVLAAQARAVATNRPGARIAPRGPPEFVAMGNDVEWMRVQAARSLSDTEAASAELTRSNADLEQFAYVASHDLSEPLRKIANFCQLLERQYADELDDRAKQYIGFAVDGAKRMQALIADLLALSRVGRTSESFTPVDTDAALRQALDNLDEAIEASGAGVGHSDMPIVPGDESLLVSLFENLIGNSIKYRSIDPPLVVVTAVHDAAQGLWTFTVQDNGIGIQPQYAERIFAIFQRLHLRDTFPGTGIGLSLCRKIVEFHGGRIWLDTQEAHQGATFRFTLPERARRDH